MSNYVHRQVVKGRLTVTTTKRTEVITKIYPGAEEEGEPVDEWFFPIFLLYDYTIPVATAMKQTFPQERFDKEDFAR